MVANVIQVIQLFAILLDFKNTLANCYAECVYTGMEAINTCHWRLQFETDFSIFKLHHSAKLPTQIACVHEPLIMTVKSFIVQAPRAKRNNYNDLGGNLRGKWF
jgi:hypothetical protein